MANLSKKKAMLAIARTARIVTSEDGSNAHIEFSYNNGEEVKWVTQEQLVWLLKAQVKELEAVSNCCGAGDIYDGNLDNNEGVCADCGEHCEMEEVSK